MKQLRDLAASPKALSTALIDLIRDRGGSFMRSRTTHSEPHGDLQLPLSLEAETPDQTAAWVEPVLTPADATAAVLLGRGFEGSRDVFARLRAPDLVAVIEVATADLVKPIARVLRHFVLGSEKAVLDGTQLDGCRACQSPASRSSFKPWMTSSVGPLPTTPTSRLPSRSEHR